MLRLIQGLLLVAATVPLFGQSNPAVNLSGMVTDSAGAPVSAASVRLENLGLMATSGQDGRFTLTGSSAVLDAHPQAPIAAILDGSLFMSIGEKSNVTITAYGLGGQALSSLERHVEAGSHGLNLPRVGSGVCFYKVKSGPREMRVKAFSIDGAVRGATMGPWGSSPRSALAKRAMVAAPLYDVISVTKAGYLKSYLGVTNSDSSNIKIKLLNQNSPKFSFFVVSKKAVIELSGSPNGFGGDLRFGETGPGAGLRGADKICATLAEKSMPGSSFKGWRAFLSVTAGPHGKQVNAVDRIGEGPWLDRLGRVLAPTKVDLMAARPRNGDPTIRNDFPNEDGIPNHQPDPTQPKEDNHHMITGSDSTGRLKGPTSTCKDWTTSDGSAANGKPTCGYSWPRAPDLPEFSGPWVSSFDAPGCGAGMDLIASGGPEPGSTIIGGGGGYGGFYCFALNP